MRLTRLLPAVFCFCAAALTAPARAELAGQVLALVGDVLALRSGFIVRLHPGARVESGDQIHTGADSNVQIRFTDWGLISIRARSDFVVSEYVYEPRPGGRERAFFSLIRGGVRSLTGLVGRHDRRNYLLSAPTATIGIRGTHFSVLMCRQDCRNADGSLAVDGLYGEVREGRIAVSPFGGSGLEREFGAGEFFHLLDEKSAPAPLLSLPPFFRNPLDEQARSGPADGAQASPLVGSVTSPLTGTAIGPVTSTLGTTLASPLTSILSPAGTTIGTVIGSPTNLLATPPAVTSTSPLSLPTTLLKK